MTTLERALFTPILIAALAGAIAGGGGVLLATRDRDSGAAEAVAATVDVVEAAVAEDVTDADTRQALATAPAVDLLAQAVVDLGDPATTVAAYAYAQCVAGSQGKQEGSAAYGCTDRGRQLDEAVKSIIARAAP